MKKITTAKKKALICGYYGHYNLGDEAILAGMLKLLQQQDDFSITVLSANPQDTQARHGVKAVQSGGRKFLPICIFTMLQNPYFILGGGDLLRDSVDYPVATIWLRYLQIALQLHRRTFVLGISVGEIWKPETKKLIQEILNQVDFLSVRDKDSKNKLENLGVSNKIHIISDLALQALPNICVQAVSTNTPICIGVSIRPFKGRGLSIDQSVYPKFQQELAKLVDFLVTEYKAIVHFLPFQTYENSYHTDDDYLSILNLLRYNQSSENFVVHRYFKSVHEANHLISQLDLMIGMRLHALILASGLGIPVIAAAYDSKVDSFMQEIGQSEYSVSLEDFEYNRLKPKITAILEEPFVARQKIQQGVNEYRQSIMLVQASIKQAIINNDQGYQIKNDKDSIRISNTHNEVLVNNK